LLDVLVWTRRGGVLLFHQRVDEYRVGDGGDNVVTGLDVEFFAALDRNIVIVE
jgi:hypothetical protein